MSSRKTRHADAEVTRDGMAPRKQRHVEVSEQERRILDLLHRMHEQIQYAYDAADCLDTATARYAGNMKQHYKRTVAEQKPEVDAALENALETIRKLVISVTETVEARINELCGAKDSDELLNIISMQVIGGITPRVTATVERMVRDKLTRQMIRAVVRKEIKTIVAETRTTMADDIKEATLETIDKLRADVAKATGQTETGQTETDDRP